MTDDFASPMAEALSALGRPDASEPMEAETVAEQSDHLALDLDDPIRRFIDIPIRVSVQLDRKRARVREILDLRPDAVLTLERSAGENVDLLVNGLRVGSGEIVVIEDAMGLRITDLIRDERGGRR